MATGLAEHPAQDDRAPLYGAWALSKIFNFPPTANRAPYVLFSLVPGLSGILESVGGLLIALGLFTRPVAFFLAGEMAFAYFMSHAPKNVFPLLNNGDSAILYCFVSLYLFVLYLFVAGDGRWSLDRLWREEAAR